MVLDEKLCILAKNGYMVNNYKDYKKLVRHSTYICKECGRVGRRKKNLCTPKRLYPKEK